MPDVKFFSQLAKVIRNAPKQLEGRSGLEWMNWLKANAGKQRVKRAELDATDIYKYLQDAPPLPRADLAATVEQRVPKVTKKRVAPEARQFESWALPAPQGRRDEYAENLLTMDQQDPNGILARLAAINDEIGSADIDRFRELVTERARLADQYRQEFGENVYRSGHFDEPNILTHYRTTTRRDAEGNPMTMVEELQSDWGQALRDSELTDNQRKDYQQLMARAAQLNAEERGRLRNYEQRLADAPPQGPYVGDTKDWTRLALKHAIADAIENNHDRVVWAHGPQQVERYDLSKQVGGLNWTRFPDGQLHLEVLEPDTGYGTAGVLHNQRFPSLDDPALDGLLGREMAARIRAQAAQQRSGYIDSPDFQMGGEGMLSYYGDEAGMHQGRPAIVTQVANELLRELGGEPVGSFPVAGIGDVPDQYFVRLPNGNIIQSAGRDRLYDQEGADIVAGRIAGARVEPATPPLSNQPGFRITPAMRAKIEQEGLPLFSAGAAAPFLPQDEEVPPPPTTP